MRYARILGTGTGFPKGTLSNQELEGFIDTSDEWIQSRTGIKTRRIADPRLGESTLSFCEEAARRALSMANVKPDELDTIIVATVSPDTVMPSVANLLQAKLGAKRAWSFDMSAACSGFLYGLTLSDCLIRSSKSTYVLLLGAETLSSLVNWRDRSTCVLFGDGAGAAVIGPSDSAEHAILQTVQYSDGNYGASLEIPHGYSKFPPSHPQYRLDMHKIKMSGSEIFKLAVRGMVDSSNEVLQKAGVTTEQVDFFIFHQANIRIIDMCLKSMGIDRNRTWINLDKYGNVSSATLPICLDEAWKAGKVGPGSLVLFSTFGGGVTWGSALVRL